MTGEVVFQLSSTAYAWPRVLTLAYSHHTPIIPTKRMVTAPYPGSAPFQESGYVNCPSPKVETYQTNVADENVINAIKPITPNFACFGIVFPVA